MSLPGGGGGGKTQTVQQTTVQELSPEQRAILKPLIPKITEFGTTPLELFPGSTIPDFSPLEVEARAGATATARGLGQPIGQALDFQNFLFSPELFSATGQVAGPAIEAAIRPLARTFAESVLPNIRSAEVFAGQVGGSRGRLAEQGAVQSFLTEAGDISADIVNTNFANALSAASRALVTAPSTFQSALIPSQILASVGGANRELETARLLEEAQRFGAEQLLAFEPARAAAGVAFGIPGGTLTSQGITSGTQGSTSALGNISGIASILATLFGAFG